MRILESFAGTGGMEESKPRYLTRYMAEIVKSHERIVFIFPKSRKISGGAAYSRR